jgi:beta-1,4-N-acetylglucosaminyltransferase
MPRKKTIFVTVGTTLFEALIEAVSTQQALDWMAEAGYTHLVVQYGKGTSPRLPKNIHDIHVETYDFKASLRADMQQADLILSHAGAGTVMEALRMKCKLAVVINTILMDNHQTELAHAMGKHKHLFVVEEPAELHDTKTWDDLERFLPVPYTGGDEYDFPRILDHFLGFASKED